MKRIISLLSVCIMCILCTVSASAVEFKNVPLTDGAGYLTDSEAEKITLKLEGIRQKYSIDVAIVTENEFSGYDAVSSADDIYDDGGYGANGADDGILLYICASARDYHITTHAKGRTIFNVNGIEYIKKNIKPQLEEGNFYSAMNTYADIAEELLMKAENGTPFNEKQYDTTYLLIVIGGALLIPLLIAWFMTSVQLSKMKTAVANDYAANYIKPGSKNLRLSRDIFLYSRITKIAKPKNESGTHRSSSGRTHGGGGGSF